VARMKRSSAATTAAASSAEAAVGNSICEKRARPTPPLCTARRRCAQIRPDAVQLRLGEPAARNP
jgi:hypothetical protein